MTVIFSCIYGSRINGTANERSDCDNRAIFYDKSHPTRLDQVHSERVEGQSPNHVPLCNFLRACATGSFREIDWLFLPANAYERPLPAELVNQRQMFITQDAHRAYAAIARLNAEKVGTAWNSKTAYHAEVFRLSAAAIAAGGVPNFANPAHTEHLRAIRYEWTQERFAGHWDREWPKTVLATDLPRHCEWGVAHRLYWRLIGCEDLIAAEVDRAEVEKQSRARRSAEIAARPAMVQKRTAKPSAPLRKLSPARKKRLVAIGEKLFQMRKAAGLTGCAIAGKIGASCSDVTRVEMGELDSRATRKKLRKTYAGNRLPPNPRQPKKVLQSEPDE